MLDFLQYSFIPAPQTPFTEVRKLLPGHYLEFDQKGVRVRQYWDPAPPNPSTSWDEAVAREEFHHLLSDSIRIQLRSEVPLGLFLSGGIDSSMLALSMDRDAAHASKSFTVQYKGEQYDANRYAQTVADGLGFDHHLATIGVEDVFRELPRIVWHLDEPHGDSADVGVHFVSMLAAESVKVVLNGAGGDELFAGYHRHRIHALKRVVHALPSGLKSSFRAAAEALGIPEATIFRFQRNSDEDRSFLWALYAFPPHRLDGFFQGRPGTASDKILSDYYHGYAGDIVNKRLFADLKFYLTDNILLALDKLTMGCSIEGRVPLLDHRLVEFAFRIPGEFKSPQGSMKGLLKRWLKGTLPDEILGAKKWGFAAHLPYWFKSGLEMHGLRLIERRPPSREGWYWGLRGRHLEACFQQCSPQQKYNLLVLELWMRLFEGQASHGDPLAKVSAQ